MRITPAFFLLFSLFTVDSVVRAQQAPAEFIAWPAASPEERQFKEPRVEKDSGAEILEWRVHLIDEVKGGQDIQRSFYHYVRMKVFNEKGKEQAGTIDLTTGPRGAILNVAGRTTKADGSTVDLQRGSVYQRDVVRVGGRKVKATSFAMPSVEPGAILEYRWVERLDNSNILYVQLNFQREFPVRKVTYFVKPLPADYAAGYRMFSRPFNCTLPPLAQDREGYSFTYLENVPAFREEIYSPSSPNLRPWALLFYTDKDPAKNAEKFWEDEGKNLYSRFKSVLKVNDEIKAAAQKAIADAKTDEEKATALVTYIQQNLRNAYDDTVSEAERNALISKLPKDRRRNAPEIFKSGIGIGEELNSVFAAMASTVGLDARPAYVSNQADVMFEPATMPDTYFLEAVDIAVKIGDGWKIYDPASRMVTPGMVTPGEEGMTALVSDPKKPVFMRVARTPASASREGRTATFKLSADGTLEGDVEETYTGHSARETRLDLSGNSAARQEEWLKERLTRQFPDSEVSAIAFENLTNPGLPLKFKYHLRAPLYAQVAGRRAFFAVFPFHRSETSPFAAAERRYPIMFEHGWQELDETTIQLPQGMTLDSADNPGSLDFGPTGKYNVTIGVRNDGAVVIKRDFTLGDNNTILFDVKNYPAFKQIFSEVQKRNAHTLALKEAQ